MLAYIQDTTLPDKGLAIQQQPSAPLQRHSQILDSSPILRESLNNEKSVKASPSKSIVQEPAPLVKADPPVDAKLPAQADQVATDLTQKSEAKGETVAAKEEIKLLLQPLKSKPSEFIEFCQEYYAKLIP